MNRPLGILKLVNLIARPFFLCVFRSINFKPFRGLVSLSFKYIFVSAILKIVVLVLLKYKVNNISYISCYVLLAMTKVIL